MLERNLTRDRIMEANQFLRNVKNIQPKGWNGALKGELMADERKKLVSNLIRNP